MSDHFQIGDLYAADGSSLAFEAYRLSTRYAVKIVQRLQHTRCYKYQEQLVGKEALDTYYVQRVFSRIQPAIREYCKAKHWLHVDRRRGGRVLWVDDRLLGPLLRDVWEEGPYPFVPSRASMRWSLKQVKSRLKTALGAIYGRMVSAPGTKNGSALHSSDVSRVAVEAAQGVDPSKRWDLFWLPGSHVDPSRVLVYFEQRYGMLEPLEETVAELGRRNIPWVCLNWGVVDRALPPWSPGSSSSPTRQLFLQSLAFHHMDGYNQDELFVKRIGMELLREVDYWRAFFRAHRVKIHFSLTSSANSSAIAQRIALDLEGGIQVGAQRSFIATEDDDLHGERPQHVFFIWGDVRNSFGPKTYECRKSLVTTGFIFDAALIGQKSEGKQIKSQLESAGAHFTVALLDNAFGDFHITRSMVVRFYRAFLEWLIGNQDAGLVIKPKKPRQFDELYEISGLLETAKSTGRCVVLSNALGRYPSDASRCADMSVGLFIGSAAIEAAIGGYRAVHCDLTKLHSHSFYQWGYEKIVFDDLDRLIAAIRRYSHDPSAEPGLGDHTPVLNQLDPYRDGMAGERVGTYIRWLLEAVDAGCDRDGAVQQANRKYAELWGADKIIRLVKGSGTVEAQGRPDGSAAREIPHAKFPSATGRERS